MEVKEEEKRWVEKMSLLQGLRRAVPVRSSGSLRNIYPYGSFGVRRLWGGDSQDKAGKEAARLEKREELKGKLVKLLESNLIVQLKRINDVKDMKLFPTDVTIRPLSETLRVFPHLVVEALDGHIIEVPKSKTVTLMLLSFNQAGYEMAQTWRDPVERHRNEALARGVSGKRRSVRLEVLDLVVTENRLYRAMAGPLLRAFRRTVGTTRHSSTAAFYGDFAMYKDALEVNNRLVGYAFLIDPKGRVRWSACARSDFQESIYLIDAISTLLDECERS